MLNDDAEEKTPTRRWWRAVIKLGGVDVDQAFQEGIIGITYPVEQDTSGFSPTWKIFREEGNGAATRAFPEKGKVGIGVILGQIWTLSQEMEIGDPVLANDGQQRYRVGTITGEYQYRPGHRLPHQRAVSWSDKYIERSAMSTKLRNSLGSVIHMIHVKPVYGEELDALSIGKTFKAADAREVKPEKRKAPRKRSKPETKPLTITGEFEASSSADSPVVIDFTTHALTAGLIDREHVHRLDRKQWNCPGVYILIGRSGREAYVGKSTTMRTRFLSHRSNPKLDWWRAVAVYRDSSRGFNTAEIGFLEGRVTDALEEYEGLRIAVEQRDDDLSLTASHQMALKEFVPTIVTAVRIAGLDLSTT